MSAQSFGTRLPRAVADGGPIVAGIDPLVALLEAWGLPDTPAGLAEFSRVGLEAVAGQVAAIKPQSAFFERHGSAGVAVLEERSEERRVGKERRARRARWEVKYRQAGGEETADA